VTVAANRLDRGSAKGNVQTMDDVIARRPVLVVFYETYLEDQNSAGFIKNVARRYTNSSLERLVLIGDRTTRRAAVLALGYLGDYSSNTAVGRALVDRDRGVRTIAENSIRDLWCRIGTRPQRQALRNVIRMNEQNKYAEAVDLATELIHETPWIAEAWCQRGTAHYHLKNYEQAISDCHQALEINPYQFTAAAGMGQCLLLQNNPLAALDAFRRALRLIPSMEEVRAQVVQLQRALRDQ
jgi:tetratricopeptide (TPR) repeat protein